MLVGLRPGGGDGAGGRRYSARLEHPMPQGIAHELSPGLEPQLLLNVLAVGLDRAYREVELVGDLTVGVAEGDPAQDVDLALGQVVRGSGWRLGGDAGAELRVQVDL